MSFRPDGDWPGTDPPETTELPLDDYNVTTAAAPMAGDRVTRTLYTYIVPALVLFCLGSAVVNCKILATYFWIRRPMSPTIQISLGLAGADAYSALCIGVGLLVNSWLPVVGAISQTSNCPLLVLEGLRLGGMIMTVLHLLFLAVNHYLGIVRPLHYASLLTRRCTAAVLAVLWILPTAYFFIYFAAMSDDGFQKEKCGYLFLKKWHFRMVFSSLFFGPFLLMVFIYAHIFKIVRQHQVVRLRFSRTGSARPHHRSDNGSPDAQATEQQLASNVKAIWTTLMILGSYMIGWVPGIIHFLMVCDDCYYPLDYFQPTTTFIICLLTNCFIILKTILNPIIYSARMSEIKIGTTKMNMRIAALCRNRNNDVRLRDQNVSTIRELNTMGPSKRQPLPTAFPPRICCRSVCSKEIPHLYPCSRV